MKLAEGQGGSKKAKAMEKAKQKWASSSAKLEKGVPTCTCGHIGFVHIYFHRVTHKQSSNTRMVTAVTTEPCSVYVTLFLVTIVTLIADLRDVRVRLCLYLQPAPSQGAGPSGQGGAQRQHHVQLCMVQLVNTSSLTIYLSTQTIHKLHYLMWILMQV